MLESKDELTALQKAALVEKQLLVATTVADIALAIHDAIVLIQSINEGAVISEFDRGYVLEDARAILHRIIRDVVIPKLKG